MSTLAELRQRVIDDLDLNEETFIDDTDLNRWINEGIRVVESHIHELNQDYFLSEADPIAITVGQNKVDYPSDIYANKVRKIIFTDGTSNSIASHEVKKIKDLTRAKELDLFHDNTTNPILNWTPSNNAAEGRKIRLFPDNGRSGQLHIFYIRNAAQLATDTDECDVDEFERFVIQYTKTQAYLKDGDPRAAESKVLEEQVKSNMLVTLAEMSPDDNNEIIMDMSHYDDSLGEYDGDF
jgi:hypothetical protein